MGIFNINESEYDFLFLQNAQNYIKKVKKIFEKLTWSILTVHRWIVV